MYIKNFQFEKVDNKLNDYQWNSKNDIDNVYVTQYEILEKREEEVDDQDRSDSGGDIMSSLNKTLGSSDGNDDKKDNPTNENPDSENHESENQKSDSQGNENQKNDSQGSESQKSDSHGSESQESDSHGSENQKGENHGSDSHGSSNHNSNSSNNSSNNSSSNSSSNNNKNNSNNNNNNKSNDSSKSNSNNQSKNTQTVNNNKENKDNNSVSSKSSSSSDNTNNRSIEDNNVIPTTDIPYTNNTFNVNADEQTYNSQISDTLSQKGKYDNDHGSRSFLLIIGIIVAFITVIIFGVFMIIRKRSNKRASTIVSSVVTANSTPKIQLRPSDRYSYTESLVKDRKHITINNYQNF